MSTLQPARVWEVKQPKLDKKRRWDVTQNWYPTYGNIKFLSKSQLTPKKRTKWYKDLIFQAREDPNVFIELVMNNTWGEETNETDDSKTKTNEFLKQAWFHEELHDLLNHGLKGKYTNEVVKNHRKVIAAFPRGGGKTTQIIGRILWELGRNSNLRIKLIAETKEVAQQRVYEIKKHIEKNPFLKVVFPKLIPTNEDQWTNSKIYIKRDIITRDPTIIASGILGSATGGRADLIIGDDVVGRRNSLTRPKLRQEVKSSWWSTWMPQLTKGGRCWYICTTWHKGDLSHEIVKRKSFVTFIVPVEEGCKTPWPERWSVSDLEEKKDDMGRAEFARAYELEASEDSDAPVKQEWLQYISSDEIKLNEVSFMLSLDLAVGDSSGDYFAGCILALDLKKKQIYVVDFINKHILLPDQITEMKFLIDKWSPSWIIIESVGMQDVIANVIKDSPELKAHSHKIFKFKPKVSKRMRLESVAPGIQKGAILFLDHLAPYKNSPKSLLIEQMLDFGIEEHDDVSDAFVQGILWTTFNLPMWSEVGISVQVI